MVKHTPKKKVAGPNSSLLGNRGLIAGLIVIAVIIAIVAIIFMSGSQGTTSPAAVSAQACGQTVIAYVNTNLVQADTSATLLAVTEKEGLYQATIKYQGRNISLYATRDCTLLFTSSYDMTQTVAPTASPTPTTPAAAAKSARPTVELFVMSYCPYGTQAESVMNPVIALLGSKANITVRYIASVGGTTVDSIQSLHGPTEAVEDLRQLCIAKYYPQQLWPYLMEYNTNCVPVRQNASSLAACETTTTGKLGIDNRKIDTCAKGSEGIGLLKADEAITDSYGVTGSPTLIINGQRYTGSRTPEAFKQGICSHFDTPPAECSVNLSAQAASATGSC